MVKPEELREFDSLLQSLKFQVERFNGGDLDEIYDAANVMPTMISRYKELKAVVAEYIVSNEYSQEYEWHGFKEAKSRIESLLITLEKNDQSIERSVTIYKEMAWLAGKYQALLEEMQNKIENLSLD